MASSARLIDVVVPERPQGVVLVLHGGASRRGSARVSPGQLSVLRMIPLAAGIARLAAGRLAVVRVLNSRRGWDSRHTPVQDVEWALGTVAERFGAGLPVCLVGHSLGGRAALLCAGHPQVTGVVALAPWVYASDVPDTSSATRIVIIHGDVDRIADPDRSRHVARAVRDRARAAYVTVAGGTHAMLGHRAAFDGLAARLAVWMLLDEVHGDVTARIAAGEDDIDV